MIIEIKFLADCTHNLPVLAKLWYEEISRHWVKGAFIKKTNERLITHLDKDKLPLAIVALSNGEPVGMTFLRKTNGIRPGRTP